MTFMINIGENLEKLRKAKGLSYRRLAEQVGISHANLSEYEKNEITPSFENVLKICKFFNVPLEYLLLGEKSNFMYNDFELAELFSEADQLEDDYRNLIKKYIRKILRNRKEKKNLIKETE